MYQIFKIKKPNVLHHNYHIKSNIDNKIQMY